MRNLFRVVFQKEIDTLSLPVRGQIINNLGRETTTQYYQNTYTVILWCTEKDGSDRQKEIDYLVKLGFELIQEEV